jgi:GNAT superfamily N-acetyltransferase
MTIRLATPADEPGIQSVIRACYDEYGFTWDPSGYMADIYDLNTHYLGQGHQFYVAEYNGSVLGTAALTTFSRLPGHQGEAILHGGKVRVASSDCSLERLYVHPQHRRLGIGIALFEHILDAARSRGSTHLELWSDKKLTKAHALYGKYGAVTVGERICDDPDESPEWGMLVQL